MKSPAKIDVDGFKRLDGKPIEGHKFWWKIYDISTADIFNSNGDLLTIVLYKTAVEENEFGNVTYIDSDDWGELIQYIIDVEKNKKKRIIKYYVEDFGWLNKSEAIRLVKNGTIDNAVIVKRKGRPYLRSFPGQKKFSEMG